MNRRDVLKALMALPAVAAVAGEATAMDLPAEDGFYVLEFPTERDIQRLRRDWEQLWVGPEKAPTLLVLPGGSAIAGPFYRHKLE